MFLLFFDAATKEVKSLNGSGRSGGKVTLETIRKDLKIPGGSVGKIPMSSVHAATVPGAAAGWVDTVEKFGSGKVTLSQILDPAIRLAEKGFPVSELASRSVSCQGHVGCHHGLNKYSGKSPSEASNRLLPTLQKCSRKTPMQRMA